VCLGAELEAYALLLDIKKAFGNVQHDVLVAQAVALGFNLALSRPPLAVHAGPRVVTMDQVVGTVVHATRAIVAGCAFADLLTRVNLLPSLDRIHAKCP